MKNLWVKYWSWREETRQNPMEAWKKTRAKGAVRVILTTAFLWGLFMNIVLPLTDYFFDGAFRGFRLSTFVICFIGGLFVGALNWREGEKEYQKSLNAQVEKELDEREENRRLNAKTIWD